MPGRLANGVWGVCVCVVAVSAGTDVCRPGSICLLDLKGNIGRLWIECTLWNYEALWVTRFICNPNSMYNIKIRT